jgi:hypothetical protein
VPERVELSAEQRAGLETALREIDPKVPEALSYLQPDLLKSLYDLNPAIPRALWEVNERKTEWQMKDTLARITAEQIHKAIDEAEDSARKFDDLGKPNSKEYRNLDKLIADQTGAARALYRASQEVRVAAANQAATSAGLTESKAEELRKTAEAAALTGVAVKGVADELANDFKASQLVYDSRRYDHEARDNQATAGLYELDVRKASLESDRHLERSKHFFYTMLAAQGGVTIATFAIALRRRSFFWGVATAAGLASITFASYVFLRM